MGLIDAAVIFFGLMIGSFLNVCIHRLPQGKSIVLPSSRCPHCDKPIRPWHNIPVLSFLLLRGRCSQCKARISWIYPGVELLTAGLFYAAYLKNGLEPSFFVAALFFSLLIVLNFIDLFERILPDVITLGGAVAGLALSWIQLPSFFEGDPFLPEPGSIWIPFLHSAVGIAVGGGVLWAAAELYRVVRKIEGMGFGDVKMMAMVGAFLGWRYAGLTIFFGSLLGAVIGTAYIYAQSKGSRYELPFGTFLALGAVCVYFWGPQLLNLYLGLF